MRGKGWLCVLLLLAVTASGCAYQKRVAASSPEPDWAMQAPLSSSDRFVFVGKGLGDNLVDTRQAADRAMKDVRDQLAKSLTNRAVALAIEITEKDGAAHKSADEECAAYANLVKKQVDQAMPNVLQDGTYWEKWMIKTGVFSPAYSKYEYYVEASISKENYGKLAADLAEQIAADIEARAPKAAPAAPAVPAAPAAPSASEAAPMPVPPASTPAVAAPAAPAAPSEAAPAPAPETTPAP